MHTEWKTHLDLSSGVARCVCESVRVCLSVCMHWKPFINVSDTTTRSYAVDVCLMSPRVNTIHLRYNRTPKLHTLLLLFHRQTAADTRRMRTLLPTQ